MPTVPTACPSMTSGRVIPGFTPRSAWACDEVWVASSWVAITSTDASWKLPTRPTSPLPMTMPSPSVMSTLRPMTALMSRAISCASDALSTPSSLEEAVRIAQILPC
jgi:hypothetical protein